MKKLISFLSVIIYGLGSPLKTALFANNLQVNLGSDPWDFKNDDYQYSGFKSQNEKDDNNTYTLEVWNSADCIPIVFSQYAVSGEEFLRNFSNLTLQIRNGLFDGTNVSTAKPFAYTVWEMIPTSEYGEGPDYSTSETSYLVRLSAKYPAGNTQFLQLVNSAYFSLKDEFEADFTKCTSLVAGIFIFLCSGSIIAVGVGYATYKKCKEARQNPDLQETKLSSSSLSITSAGQRPNNTARQRLLSPNATTSPPPQTLTINQ